MDIEIKSPTTRDEMKAYYDLRYRVLREPWGQPKGSEKDDYEPLSQHFMAVDRASGTLIAVAKLFENTEGVAWVSHLAVKPELQHKGYGRMLVSAVEEAARQKGYQRIGLMSRLNTTTYFEKMGYRVTGMPSHYFGTTQVVWMEKPL